MAFPPQGVGGAGGIRKLSELEIDTDKDWNQKRITNIGAPLSDLDVPRARAEDILSGVFDVARIPDLDASKITTGVFSLDRIPTITRAKLEYPTVDVSLTYLSGINKTVEIRPYTAYTEYYGVVTSDSFTDKAVQGFQKDGSGLLGRSVDQNNTYWVWIDTTYANQDHYIGRLYGGSFTRLAYGAVDLPSHHVWLIKFSISGSTLKAYREDMTTPKMTVTDTYIASGRYGSWSQTASHSYPNLAVKLLAPSSPSPPALAVVEIDVEGSGNSDDPFRPNLASNLIEIDPTLDVPDFLKLEKKRYDVLKNKGFTNEEIKLLLGYIPQHQIDLNAVTWGAFELSKDSPTNIITIQSDNPYQSGAVLRQVEFIERKGLRKFNPPRDFREAVELFNTLKRDHPHWLAGKDNFAYQVFGFEIFEDFQNVDFYYGEFLEHQTHYNQLKQVPDFEIENRLVVLEDKLSRANVLIEERDKHLNKLKEIEKKGW